MTALVVHRTGPQSFAITEAGARHEWSYADQDEQLAWLGCDGWAWSVREALSAQEDESSADGELRAPMPGQVLLVPAAVGQAVSAGDPVVVLESMKMELVMSAPVDGLVAELNVAVGDKVAVDQPLARVEASVEGPMDGPLEAGVEAGVESEMDAGVGANS